MIRALSPAFRRGVTVVAGVAVAALALVPAVSPATTADAASGGYLAAAEYFGSGNPTNMWSSDLSGAPKAFALMKKEGFNTVGLVLPWGQFQPGLTPPTYDSTTFARLDRLIAQATRLHMGVILRLSYEWDIDPNDQLPGSTRFSQLWSNPKVYAAWLDYVATVHQNVAQLHNVRAAYISWEDLWEPVFEAQGTTTPSQRLSLATSTGYRSWLHKRYSLRQVEFDYGTQFANWTAVPVPPATKPSFKLMYQYQDTALVHRLFLPAAQRFPGLTMESRADVDSILTGTTVAGSYTHRIQYRLPGTSVTGMYFSPYMGDPSSAMVESATDALRAMHSTLSRMSKSTGGRPLVIYEYEFESNANAVDHDPALTPNQVPQFLAGSKPLLQRYTHGYALWTFRDYYLSSIYNPSFALGSSGWKLTDAQAVENSSSPSYALFGPQGGAVSQDIASEDVTAANPPSVSFRANAPAATNVLVRLGSSPAQTVSIAPGWHTYTVALSPTSTGTVTLQAGGGAELTDVSVYWFTQLGDVYSTAGTPEVGAAPLRSLNAQLTGSG